MSKSEVSDRGDYSAYCLLQFSPPWLDRKSFRNDKQTMNVWALKICTLAFTKILYIQSRLIYFVLPIMT
jgi:hypothetical protein